MRFSRLWTCREKLRASLVLVAAPSTRIFTAVLQAGTCGHASRAPWFKLQGLQGNMAVSLSQLDSMLKHNKSQSRSLCDVAAVSAADSMRLAGGRGRESVQGTSAR